MGGGGGSRVAEPFSSLNKLGAAGLAAGLGRPLGCVGEIITSAL